MTSVLGLQRQASIAATPDTSTKRKLLAEFFSCPICQDTMSHPYTIVDCMHKFDKDCLSQFWSKNAACPLCKQPSTKALHDFTLQNIIDSAGPPQDEGPLKLDNTPIFPSPLLALGPSRGFGEDIFTPSNDDMEGMWSNDADMEEDFAEDITARLPLVPPSVVRPGGDLIFPCNSCIPDNDTGYTCDDPIPMPTQEDVNQEIQRTGRSIRLPVGSEPRAPLSLGDFIPGVMSHLQCEGCSIYVPRHFPANIRCTVCRKVYCGEYAGKSNCGGISVHSADALVYKSNSVRELAVDSFPEYVRLNKEEIDRFEAYTSSQGITVQALLQQVVEAKEKTFEMTDDDESSLESQGVWRANPWGNAILCTTCIEALVRVQSGVWEWWIKEREKGSLDPAIRALPDCWYGWECRTQAHSFPRPTHASRYNHICPRRR